MAAWAVAELEAAQRDPNYLGAVSVAGAGDFSVIVRRNSEPGSFSAFYDEYIAYAIHGQSPEFTPADMLVGAALKRYPYVTTKGCWNYLYASFLNERGAKVVRPDWDRKPAVSRFFKRAELGHTPISGPLYVIAGEADQTVPLAAIQSTRRRACQNGIALFFRSYPGLDHDPVMDQSTPDKLAWIRDRFAGKPFVSNCATLPKQGEENE